MDIYLAGYGWLKIKGRERERGHVYCMWKVLLKRILGKRVGNVFWMGPWSTTTAGLGWRFS